MIGDPRSPPWFDSIGSDIIDLSYSVDVPTVESILVAPPDQGGVMTFTIRFPHRGSGRFAGGACPPKKLFADRWLVSLSASLAAIVLLAGGCTALHHTVKGLPENEEAAVRAGEKAVVLFRLAPRLDNVPVTPAGTAINLEFPFFVFWADIDRRERPRVLEALSPSEEAAAGNWVYYVVPPGVYWIGVRGLGGRTTWEYGTGVDISRRNSFVRSDFFLEVPRGVPLLYAGTLSAACRTVWKVFGRRPGWCGRASIEDQSEAAEIVALRDLGNLGPMETLLVRRGGFQSAAEEPGDLAPMAVSLKGLPALLTPHWKERGVGRATGLGSDAFLGLLGPPSSSGGAATSLDRYQGYAFLGYALYLPIGSAVGLLGGHQSERKWSPCMNMIAAEVAGWSPPDALRAALVEALARRGVGDITVVDNASWIRQEDGRLRFRTLFEVEIQEVVFRECGKRWTFCGEMKVRGRLRDLVSGRLLYDGILVYSNGSRRFAFARGFYTRPYEWLVISDAMCRAIEDYCDPGGAEFLIRDLDSAVRFLAERLVLEAGVPPGHDGAPGLPDDAGAFSSSSSSSPPKTP